MKREVVRVILFLVILCLYFFVVSMPVAANCDCGGCAQGYHCQVESPYECGCVRDPPTAVPTPKPTSRGEGGGGATLAAGITVAPKASVIPTKTLSPYETACGAGKCTNGWYCCQNTDATAACCPVGPPDPTGGATDYFKS